MAEQCVGIVVECICDLPKEYFCEHGVGVIYFLVKTDRGEFLDTEEITAENIISYMEAGNHVPVSSPPPAKTYIELFEKMLKKYKDVILVCTGRRTSLSYDRAVEAVGEMGAQAQRVHIFDSKHLSTGLGHVVMRAVEMAENGCSSEEIISELTKLRERVSTTFITVNADYLYRNKRVSNTVKKLCDTFGIHPVLVMKEGRLTLKSILFGNYEKAGLRYVRHELSHADRIDKSRIFITQVGVNTKELEKIKAEIYKKCNVRELIVTKASATVSSNCGPGTFGVLFVNDR